MKQYLFYIFVLHICHFIGPRNVGALALVHFEVCKLVFVLHLIVSLLSPQVDDDAIEIVSNSKR